MFFKKKINVAKFIMQYAENSSRSNAYKRVYRNIARKFAAFNNSLKSSDFSDEVCCQFVDFLKKQNLKQNTIKNLLDKSKYMFRLMSKRGYAVNWTFEEIIEKAEQVSSIYLTIEEIERLYKLENISKENRLIIDLFVIGCYTGLRYSDYKNLNKDNFSDKFITRKTIKTGETVLIPIHFLIKEILTRYDDFPCYRKSQQNFNKRLKYLCKIAKIDEEILVEYTQGGKVIRENKKKYELVGTHTARRSFATNMYLSGIQPFRIMLLTGHRSEMSFFKYIKIQKEENAEYLSNNPFFNK